jgi:hypothetical protein
MHIPSKRQDLTPLNSKRQDLTPLK